MEMKVLKKIGLLGASGSIGTQTQDVLRNNKDQFELKTFSVGKRTSCISEILEEFPSVTHVSVLTKETAEAFEKQYPNVTFVYGMEGLIEISTHKEIDILVTAISGSIGLQPTYEAICQGKTIALANKETLVAAGDIIMEAAMKHKVSILPVDSEHSAIFQALQGEKRSEVERLIITASGGSFRDKARNELEKVTVKEALAHPNWNMGNMLTIDSATMFNKGLEVIEAHYLYNIPYEKIDVSIHRQSIVHSLVEFVDTSIMAQLSVPDMRLPIQYALSYPERIPLHDGKRMEFTKLYHLDFEPVSYERFPALALAYRYGKQGGYYPCLMNAAKERVVHAFLNEKLPFSIIEETVEHLVDEFVREHSHVLLENRTIERIVSIDASMKKFADTYLEKREQQRGEK